VRDHQPIQTKQISKVLYRETKIIRFINVYRGSNIGAVFVSPALLSCEDLLVEGLKAGMTSGALSASFQLGNSLCLSQQ